MQTKVLKDITSAIATINPGLEAIKVAKFSNTGKLSIQHIDTVGEVASINYDFQSDTMKFSITIKNVILKSSNNNSTPSAVSPIGVNKTNTPCTPPKGYKYLNIEFPNPTFDGCFVLPQNMTSTIVSGRDLRVTITFKADSNLHNTISNLQVQP
jgi:hypothetical protein